MGLRAETMQTQKRYKEVILKKNHQCRALILSTVAIIIAWAGIATAQDNRIPLNWGNLTVKITETFGNNNTKPLRGAKVELKLKEPENKKALTFLKKYPVLKFPMTRSSGARGAGFGKLPPSRDVRKYILTVIPKPNDHKKEYICVEKRKKDTREIRLGGGKAMQHFNYKCQKANMVNEFNRRQIGGFDLIIKLKNRERHAAGTFGFICLIKMVNASKKFAPAGRPKSVFVTLIHL